MYVVLCQQSQLEEMHILLPLLMTSRGVMLSYFLKRKSEVPSKFKEFEQRICNDCDQKISTLRSDNGGEYLSNEFKIYLKSKGLHHELTVPHCPEQNGVAERMNRTLMEMARSMLAHAGLPDKY